MSTPAWSDRMTSLMGSDPRGLSYNIQQVSQSSDYDRCQLNDKYHIIMAPGRGGIYEKISSHKGTMMIAT